MGKISSSEDANLEMWQVHETGDNFSPLVRDPESRTREVRCDRCGSQCQDTPHANASAVILKCVAVAAFGVVLFVLGCTRGASPILPLASKSYGAESRRSFVCITGQLERLELENKIATLLQPLRQAGYEPDIALLLDDTTSFVTNDQRLQVDYFPPFSSYGDAAEHLRELDFNVITDGPYKQAAEPVVNDEYVRLLHKHTSMTVEKHLERAKNNIRMLESWAQCYHEMSKDLHRAGNYDLAIRIREDSGFLEALDIDDIVDELAATPKTIISNGCRFGGGGMNDKFAIVSMDAAQTYFVEPFRYLYAKPIDERVKSSETFIYYTYEEEQMNVIRSDSIRHIIKLMSDEDGRTTLYPQEKKKLEKSCNIVVSQNEEPSSCTTTWDADQHLLKTSSQTCWPFIYTD